MKRETKTLELLRRITAARELMDASEHERARDELLALRRESPAVSSAHVSYLLAIVYDCLAEPQLAAAEIEAALAQDPLSEPFNCSFDIINESIRSAIGSAEATDEALPRLYDLLVSTGEADAGSHLVMARAHLRRGNPQAALRLLQAVTVLEPTNRKAWSSLADAARAVGDAALVREAEAALSRSGGSPAVVCPGRVGATA